MYFRFIFLLIFLSLNSYCQDGTFSWQNPLPHGNDLNGCCVVSDSYVWAVGDIGTIVKSTDKGATWTMQHSGVTKKLNAVTFIDTLNGWICGNTAILHTTDGGANWVEQEVPFVPSINDIQFINQDKGWAVCNQAHILRTIDGGENWSISNFNLMVSFLSIQFIDSLNGFVSGTKGTFFKTTDGGLNWEASDYFSQDYYLKSVYFTSAETGYLTGTCIEDIFTVTVILKTENGGESWVSYFPGSGMPSDMVFTDPIHGYIAGNNSIIYQTSDAGESWSYKRWGEYYDLQSIAFFNDEYGISVGEDAHVLRKFGGLFHIWKYNEIGTTAHLYDIQFTSEYNGWVSGHFNYLLHTLDGGNSWSIREMDLPENAWTLAIYFLNPLKGWVAGSNYSILHSDNGGTTWTYQSTIINGRIQSFFFLDENVGWAVGEVDSKYRTTNGGQTWNSHNTGLPYSWNDVYFKDPLNGFVVGDQGRIHRSEDGGISWILQNSGTQEDLLCITFIDSLKGFITGENSTVLKTSDGGNSWSFENIGNGHSLNDIQFINSMEGWIACDYGNILYTSDQGGVWTEQARLTGNYLYALDFMDNGKGWFCGSSGTIINYQPNLPVGNLYLNDGNNPVLIYPNPCQTKVCIQLEPFKYELITIYSIEGKLMMQRPVEEAVNYNEKIIIDMSGFSPGIYILNFCGNASNISEKIIHY